MGDEAKRTMDVASLAEACGRCTTCGTPYQTQPMLGIFPDGARTLVIAQNPGEIKDSDGSRLTWIRMFEQGRTLSPIDFLRWYEWDFRTSNGYSHLEQILGVGWLDTGVYAYTNAVRCRTAGNETPGESMVKACSIYTRQLVRQYDGLILMGRVAIQQVFGDPMALDFMAVKVVKGKTVLAVPHYSSWARTGASTISEAMAAVQQFQETLSRVGGK